MCKLERCPELTPDVPRVRETQESRTKGFYSSLLRGDRELYVVSWHARTKINVNIDILGERERGLSTLEICGARLRRCDTYQYVPANASFLRIQTEGL